MPYKNLEDKRVSMRKHYRENRDKYREYSRRSTEGVMMAIAETKEGVLCLDCGGSFPAVCMDYHHRDPSEKTFAIGRARAFTKSIPKVLAEIEKCDLICANCHRLREYGNR